MPASLARPALLAATAALLASPLAAQERHVLPGPAAAIWNLAGDVRLEAGSGADVVVELTRGGSDGRRLDVVASGGQLKVRYPANEVVYRGGSGNGRSSSTLNVRDDGTFNGDWNGRGRRTTVRTSGSGLEAHANLVIKVPAGKRLEVNLAIGTVEVTNVDGDLRIDVHSAEVRASGTKGRLVVDAGSGSVRVENASGELEVSTGSGSVTAENLTTDDLFVDTGSGSVRVDLTKVPRRTGIDTGSGSVSITLPTGSNADLDLESSSGGISSDFPVTMNDVRRHSLRGKIGEGGPIIQVSSGSGGVRLLKR